MTRALLDAVGLLALALLLALVGQIPGAALADGQALSQALAQVVSNIPLLLVLPPLVGIGPILLFYMLLGRCLDRRPWRQYGLHLTRRWGRDFLFGFLLGSGLIGLPLSWNFFMGNVFGLPVSGAQQGVSLLLVSQTGPLPASTTSAASTTARPQRPRLPTAGLPAGPR
ncbi:MAG TPA: hypothetical protein VK879_19445 [Candidatus Sulfomarinibacteraceae bacterium]|nr:hypothetical protein [Candidatus Sulfomarinibacteraceae bacterium]